jgi:DNA-binding transcriptional LysR family regulator
VPPEKHFTPASTDLRKLHHAVVLAQAGSFARAATQLFLTQSALTRSIQSLERELGLRLFDRSNAGVKPTPAARMVLERAQALLLQARNLARDVELIRGAEIGNIALGASPIAGAIFVPPAVTAAYSLHPQLVIAVDLKSSLALLADLLEEKIEFFVGNTDQFGEREDIAILPLARIRVEFFVRAGHPLASKGVVMARDLAPYTLISSRFVSTRLSVMPFLYGPGTEGERAARFVCDDLLVQKALALGSDAVLLGARDCLRAEADAGALVALRIEDAAPMNMAASVVRLAGRSLSPTAELLVQHMRQIARQLKKSIAPSSN